MTGQCDVSCISKLSYKQFFLKMKITLVPYAGLCNRLNAIISGLAYKEKYPNTELTILWHKWWHCNCRFHDLFKQLPSPYTPVNELVMQLKDIPGNRLNFNIPQMLRSLWYDYSFLPGAPSDQFEELTKGKQNVYVNKDNRFWKEETHYSSFARFFKPTDELQSRIDEVTRDWNGKVVGLHIRRTDNLESIKQSPMEHFYEVIEKEIGRERDMRFYLATDDEKVKNDLKGRYGERIITLPLCLRRNSLQGMKDAVVDLYCLASTKKIYGSSQSTYSIFASKLFDIELEI